MKSIILIMAIIASAFTASDIFAANVDVDKMRIEAEQGNVEAQSMLGMLYQWGGQGIKQNNSEAIKWLDKAAEQKNTMALAGLGYAYREGKGVKRDLVKAYAYYAIAEKTGGDGSKDATRHKNELTKRLTPKQITKANKIAEEWLEKHK